MLKKMRNAVKKGELDVLKALLAKEPGLLDAVTPFGTWLHIAAAHGRLEIVEYLVGEACMDVNARGGTFSGNALERAAAKGYLSIAEYLILHGIEMDVSEPERNPLFAAIHGGHLDVVRCLADSGIDLGVQYTGSSMKNMDALAFAVERGETEITEYLKLKMHGTD